MKIIQESLGPYLNLKVVKWLIFVDDIICWWGFFYF